MEGISGPFISKGLCGLPPLTFIRKGEGELKTALHIKANVLQ